MMGIEFFWNWYKVLYSRLRKSRVLDPGCQPMHLLCFLCGSVFQKYLFILKVIF